MDAYPPQFLAHNIPLVALLGLETPPESEVADEEQYPLGGHDSGLSFSTELPPIVGTAADALLQAFRDLDARHSAWNSRPGPGKMGSMAFTSRSIGRTFTLPPHEAPMPPQSELDDVPSTWQTILHSPISPLTPSSKLFPDGIMSPAWSSKHQILVPSAVICFFSFTVDGSRSSLQDNALKTQINKFKEWKADTKYAIRIVVVLVCDEPAPVSTVVERLGNIRRSTNMDTKTLLYMPGGLSVDETRAYVGSLLSNIHPACIEYYRDLSKHARRKKNRASIPQPTVPPTFGTSQTLSARGWNVRYEFKLGVFAEFRGEMDAAERNYEQAYEDLMDGDVFEGISSWSPRFSEARMLADVLAIRILRCLLWTNQTTSAAQSWANHKFRMQEIVDKKGKGSNTYAWQAWEATWSTVMAQLIEHVEIPYFQVPKAVGEGHIVTPNLFAPPERTLAKEILISPWDHLHHPGYWYARSAQRLQSRRELANSIPAEDRVPSGESSASALANRSHLYDTYLVPDPQVEYSESIAPQGLHSTLIIDAYGRATMEASDREQERTLEKFRLNEAREMTRRGEWEVAAKLLRPCFEDCSYVREHWWMLWQDVLLLASKVATHLEDGDLLLLANWQLQSSWLTIPGSLRPSLHESISALGLPTKPILSPKSGSTAPVIAASLTFGDTRACVGDHLPSQLVLKSYVRQNTGTMAPSYIDIQFTGSTSLTRVRLEHEEVTDRYVGVVPGRPKLFQKVQLDAGLSDVSLIGKADLTIEPDRFNIYEFDIVPIEVQALTAKSIRICVDNEYFGINLEQELQEPRISPLHWWQPKSDGMFSRRSLWYSRYRTVDVLPRPPKVEVTFPDHQGTYYTDERAEVTIRTINGESEAADVRLKVRLADPKLDALVRWFDSKRESQVLVGETGVILPQRDLGIMEPDAAEDVVFTIERLAEMTEIHLEIEAVYTLASKPNTITTKSVKRTLDFIRPFEANYESVVGVHPSPWPSYFDLPGDEQAAGICQRSYMTAKIVTFTKEPVIIERIDLCEIEPKDHSIVCKIENTMEQKSIEMQPEGEAINKFCIDMQKHDLDDRLQAQANLVLTVTWRRKSAPSPSPSHSPSNDPSSSSTSSTTTLIAAPLVVFDFGKPRALASAYLVSVPGSVSTQVIQMTYTLENPSDFMLTFGITMDTSDQFAFAGPKATSKQLTPFSRAEVRFTLLPLVRNAWISPVVRVNDIGFKENLRVVAADGVKGEKGRCLIWIPGEEQEAE